MAQVISESAAATGNEQRPFYDFLEACLRHKAEMVIFEAARAICNMPEVATRELTPAVTVLQLFLSSAKPVLRFAAVRTLNKVTPPLALHFPLRLSLSTSIYQDSTTRTGTMLQSAGLVSSTQVEVAQLLRAAQVWYRKSTQM